MSAVISIENLSKSYRLGQIGTGTLANDLKVWSAKLRRKPNPLLQIGQEDHGNRDGEVIWALKDVSFTVEKGEVLGIIGRNGAGKSTLLKILSRVTAPTAGQMKVKGRIASLLEVGTGFHPELTGRENIYLNGAILGMRREEIDKKLDDIVAFSEIETFIDTPVKRYSSGMYVRLAFAVAAHLEPEILLIDEVLAVGDAGFQKKCIGKMGDVAKGGRTILFVSHNMGAILHLCSNAILLDAGQITTMGKTSDVVTEYHSIFSSIVKADKWIDLSYLSREGTGEIRFKQVKYNSQNETIGCQPYTNGPLEFTLLIESQSHKLVSSIAVTLYDEFGTRLINMDTVSLSKIIEFKRGLNYIKIRLKNLFLSPGVYSLGLWMANPPAEVYDWIKGGMSIEVIDSAPQEIGIKVNGAVFCDFDVSRVE